LSEYTQDKSQQDLSIGQIFTEVLKETLNSQHDYVVINDKKLRIKNWENIRRKPISLMSKDEKDIVLVIVLKNIWDLLGKRNLQDMVQSWDELAAQLDLNEDNVQKIDKVNDDLWMLKIANMDKWTLVDQEKQKMNEMYNR